MYRQFLVLLFWILPLSTWADQHLKMDTSEVTIAEFSEFADAVGLLTKAEKEGGMVYDIQAYPLQNASFQIYFLP